MHQRAIGMRYATARQPPWTPSSVAHAPQAWARFRTQVNASSGRTWGHHLAGKWLRGPIQDPRPLRSTEWSRPRQTTHIMSRPRHGCRG
eukprot:3042738-Pleurochrysis_carterae.AAC.4